MKRILKHIKFIGLQMRKVNKELSEETKRLVKEAEDDFSHGRVYTHEQIKKELNL